MPEQGLDAEKLRLLDEWATGLQRDDRPEVAAAGRAILMLVEEVERLHVHLWDRHLNLGDDTVEQEVPSVVEPDREPESEDDHAPELDRSLRRRLFRRRDSFVDG